MTLHAIGDSHVRLFWELTDPGRVHWLGPMLMHRVARDGLAGLRAAREWLDQRGTLGSPGWTGRIQAGSTVAWVFGEIDVRCHLAARVASRGDAVLAELADGYLATVVAFSSATETRPVVVSVTPAMDANRNPAYPCRGPLAERRRITSALNDLLRERCQNFCADFVDAWPLVADDAGGILAGLTEDDLHLGPASAPLVRQAMEAADAA